jgi:hypothetical protein
VIDEPTGSSSEHDSANQPSNDTDPTKGVTPAVGPHSQTRNPSSNAADSGTQAQPTPELGRWTRFHRKVKDIGIHDWITLVAAVCVAIATIFYTRYASGQLDTMRQTLEEMKRSGQQTTDQANRVIANMNWLASSMDGSLKEAQRALDASIADSKNVLRPYVYVSKLNLLKPVVEGKAIQAEAELLNSGRTPAIQVLTCVDLVALKSAESLGDKYPCPSPENLKNGPRPGTSFGSTAVIGPNNPPIGSRSPETTITPDQPGLLLILIQSRLIRVYFYGDIRYADLLNPTAIHHTHFCGVLNMAAGRFDMCDHHNNAD